MASPKLLTTEQIFAAKDRPEKVIKVPGWGAVKIRTLSLRDRDFVTDKATDPETGEVDDTALHAWLVQRAVVEPAIGEDQVEELKDRSVQAIEYIVAETAKLSGGTSSEIVEAEAQFLDES